MDIKTTFFPTCTILINNTSNVIDQKCLTDFAGQSLNTSFLSPYLDSLGSNFSNGANFAVAGSVTLPKDIPFALNIQVMQFKHFKDHSAELVAAGDFVHQISCDLINYYLVKEYIKKIVTSQITSCSHTPCTFQYFPILKNKNQLKEVAGI